MIIGVKEMLRRQNSINANPRWAFVSESGYVYLTAPDLAKAYELTGDERGLYRLEFDVKGRVIGWEREGER